MLTVAHELRSPVAAAQSLMRTLLRGLAGQLNSQQREILDRIESRHGLLLDLINDLLALAASKTYDPDRPLERMALSPSLLTVLDRVRDEAGGKGVALTSSLADAPLMVMANGDGLERVFSNLLGNAVKYTPSGGSVEVRTRAVDGGAEVSVTDTGIGIPEEDLSRLGDEFFRARNVRGQSIGGTGLGLSIVREQLRRLHGRMQVESREGQGSVFRVWLPCIQDP
jgi:signal transduction histidine kinase